MPVAHAYISVWNSQTSLGLCASKESLPAPRPSVGLSPAPVYTQGQTAAIVYVTAKREQD